MHTVRLISENVEWGKQVCFIKLLYRLPERKNPGRLEILFIEY